jgi:D-alanine-D-alanine ligase
MTVTVNVVMGGPSAEHEVSLRSGLEVMMHLDRTLYRPRALLISHRREFFFSDPGDSPLEPADLTDPSLSPRFEGPAAPAASQKFWEGCDVAFLALHGTFGEDGTLQGFLETLGMPYTGSGVCGSAVAMDKITSKFLYLAGGLTVPPWSIYRKGRPDGTIESLEAKHGYPCFVKAPQSGSSRLMGRADDRQSLAALLDEFSPQADRLLIETAVNGIEFSCGVLDTADNPVTALPPIEIRPRGQAFFDFTAKYTTGKSEEIVPAERPEPLLERVKETAVAAHRLLGCRGVSRTDMILADDALYVLETNTLPGMTANSLLPKEFIAAGGTYAGLLDTLITAALRTKTSGLA